MDGYVLFICTSKGCNRDHGCRCEVYRPDRDMDANPTHQLSACVESREYSEEVWEEIC